MTRNQARITYALYGIAGRTALQLSVPLLARRNYDVVHGATSFEYVTEGLGDVVLGARRAVADRDRLVAGLAVKAATGRSDVLDPAQIYILEPMIQPGPGATGFVASLQWSRSLAGTSLTLAGSGQLNTTNQREYRTGHDLIGSISLARPVLGRVSASLQVKGWRKYRSEYVGEPVPSTGGRVLYVTPGLRVKLPARASLYSFLQVPAWQDVNEEQLAPRYALVVGASKTF